MAITRTIERLGYPSPASLAETSLRVAAQLARCRGVIPKVDLISTYSFSLRNLTFALRFVSSFELSHYFFLTTRTGHEMSSPTEIRDLFNLLQFLRISIFSL